MNATGKRRLLKLADFLATKVKPRRFDMSTWGEGDEIGKPVCGTSACALGWASAVPSLRKAGAKLATRRSCRYWKQGTAETVSRKVFGLNYNEHCSLFETDVYASGRTGLRAAVKRIRDFVKRAA